MINNWITGIVYIILGFIVRWSYAQNFKSNESYLKSTSVNRTSTGFIMCGIANLCLGLLSLMLPKFAWTLSTIGVVFVLMFLLIVILESNSAYRKYRDDIDRMESEYADFRDNLVQFKKKENDKLR